MAVKADVTREKEVALESADVTSLRDISIVGGHLISCYGDATTRQPGVERNLWWLRHTQYEASTEE
jgi:hypothetical protein